MPLTKYLSQKKVVGKLKTHEINKEAKLNSQKSDASGSPSLKVTM